MAVNDNCNFLDCFCYHSFEQDNIHCFSNKYEYTFYDENGRKIDDLSKRKIHKIKRKLNPNYIDDFYNIGDGEIPVDVSAVVGNNGVGKTRLLFRLFEKLNSASFNMYWVYREKDYIIFIFRNGNVLFFDSVKTTTSEYFTAASFKKYSFKKEKETDEEETITIGKDADKGRMNAECIYYTIADDFILERYDQGILNISKKKQKNKGEIHDWSLLGKDLSNTGDYFRSGSSISKYTSYQVLNQLSFVHGFFSQKEGFEKFFGFEMHNFRIRLKGLRSRYKSILSDPSEEYDMLKISDGFSVEDALAAAITYTYIYRTRVIVSDKINDDIFRSLLLRITEKLSDTKRSVTDNAILIMKRVWCLVKDHIGEGTGNDELLEDICALEYIMKLRYTYNLFRSLPEWVLVNDDLDEDPYFDVPPVYFDVTKKFIKSYKSISKMDDLFEFSWGYSSGEMALLNFYSKLYDYRHETTPHYSFNPDNSLLLLIDEADMLLHPQWQKSFVKNVISGVREIFKGVPSIQIILATHSPIMLSDIPKQNIIFLKKDEEGRVSAVEGMDTFSANIFELFKNAFFLENGYIGDFALEKLQWIIKEIHKDGEVDKELILRNIKCIGDTFLRKELLDEYKKKFAVVDERAMLEAQMAELQKRLDELERKDAEAASEGDKK